jgi:hypothetical protein
MFAELGIEDGSKGVSVSRRFLSAPEERIQNYLRILFVVLTTLSVSNANSIAFNDLITAKNRLERMWNTFLSRIVVILAD